MDAVLLEQTKRTDPDGTIIEVVVWQAQEPVEGSSDLHKYRLFYGRDGVRLVGFDNERGKGGHCHIDRIERPYNFSTVQALVRDFYVAIADRNAK
jgi:hypothetical protein